jgi:hypothetical protein
MADIEHYVPQFFLRQFSTGEDDQVCVYDKQSGRIFTTHVRNIAAEKGFYNLQLDNKTLSLEPSLAKLEENAAAVMRKVLDSRCVTTIGKPERAMLCAFLAVQLVRTKEHRLKFAEFTRSLREKLPELGFGRSHVEKAMDDQPDDLKWFGVTSVLQSADLIPYFLNKTWVLFKSPREHPLYTSDNPITLHNDKEYGPHGNIGLAVKGIQIYFPMSIDYCLALLCPSIGDQFKETYYDLQRSTLLGLPVPPRISSSFPVLEPLWEGILFGTAVPLEPENVTMINSLQVVHSSRFVYCSREDFSLAVQMVQNDPNLKHGRRFTID